MIKMPPSEQTKRSFHSKYSILHFLFSGRKHLTRYAKPNMMPRRKRCLYHVCLSNQSNLARYRIIPHLPNLLFLLSTKNIGTSQKRKMGFPFLLKAQGCHNNEHKPIICAQSGGPRLPMQNISLQNTCFE